jgi:hypothetical protein
VTATWLAELKLKQSGTEPSRSGESPFSLQD